MGDIKVLYQSKNKALKSILVIRENSLYPGCVEIIDVFGDFKSNCYLLPKKAIIETAKVLNK